MVNKRKVPNFLYDKEGNIFAVILEKHRKGFNLITHRQSWEEFEK